MSKCLASHTNPGATYPGYINFTREDDGTVTVYFRGDPSKSDGEYICGYAADKGKPGRCTPGDEFCNNYCNMAPQKGPMKPAPLPCVQIQEGKAAALKLSAEAFQAFLGNASDTKQLREVLASCRFRIKAQTDVGIVSNDPHNEDPQHEFTELLPDIAEALGISE